MLAGLAIADLKGDPGLGFIGFRVEGSGFRVLGLGFRARV